MSPATLSVAPQGFWLKTHFYREGNLLHVVAYSCIAGNPEVFNFSVDIRPIIAAVVKGHNALHKNASLKVSGEDVHQVLMGCDPVIGGFFDDIAAPFKSVAASAASIVNKVGKSKLVSQVGNAVKDVVKSKVTGGILATAAIVFPPVGAPAVAAYVAANASLMAIDQAKSVVATAKKIVDKATPANIKNALKGELNKWAGATIQKAVSEHVTLPKGLGPLAQAVKLAKDKAETAKKVLGVIAQKAKAGDVEAQKAARIVNLAHNARKQLTAIKHAEHKNMPRLKGRAPASSNLNGFPAVLVHSSGRIIPGRYIEKKGAPSTVILRKGKVLRGNFAAVSGDFDRDVGSIGCANPFLGKPGHLR